MLSITVTSLPIHGQIFNHVEVSTQYDFIFGCDIAFQFVKEDFLLGGYIGSIYICYLKFFFCVSTVTDIIWPALSDFSNSTVKFLDSLQSIATLLLVLLSDGKIPRPVQSFFQWITFSSVLCVSWRSIISNLELQKVWKILFLFLLSWRLQ